MLKGIKEGSVFDLIRKLRAKFVLCPFRNVFGPGALANTWLYSLSRCFSVWVSLHTLWKDNSTVCRVRLAALGVKEGSLFWHPCPPFQSVKGHSDRLGETSRRAFAIGEERRSLICRRRWLRWRRAFEELSSPSRSRTRPSLARAGPVNLDCTDSFHAVAFRPKGKWLYCAVMCQECGGTVCWMVEVREGEGETERETWYERAGDVAA